MAAENVRQWRHIIIIVICNSLFCYEFTTARAGLGYNKLQTQRCSTTSLTRGGLVYILFGKSMLVTRVGGIGGDDGGAGRRVAGTVKLIIFLYNKNIYRRYCFFFHNIIYIYIISYGTVYSVSVYYPKIIILYNTYIKYITHTHIYKIYIHTHTHTYARAQMPQTHKQ